MCLLCHQAETSTTATWLNVCTLLGPPPAAAAAAAGVATDADTPAPDGDGGIVELEEDAGSDAQAAMALLRAMQDASATLLTGGQRAGAEALRRGAGRYSLCGRLHVLYLLPCTFTRIVQVEGVLMDEACATPLHTPPTSSVPQPAPLSPCLYGTQVRRSQRIGQWDVLGLMP